MQTRTDKLGKVSLTIEGAWSPRRDYDKLSVVTDGPNYINYVSRIPVPKGTPLTNEKYWIKFSSLAEQIVLDYNAFISRYGQKLEDIKKDIGDLNKLKTKDKSSTVAAINESLINKINVVNIADYITSGDVMPGNADVYIMKDNKFNYLPHYNIIAGEDGTTLELVFCIFHYDGKGGIYTVFKQYNTNNWIIKDQYYSNNVPEYILKNLGEQNQANEINILHYIDLLNHGIDVPPMPANCNIYCDWGEVLGTSISLRLPIHQGCYTKYINNGLEINLVVCIPLLIEFPVHHQGHGNYFAVYKGITENNTFYWKYQRSYAYDKEYNVGEKIPSWVLEAVGENATYELPEIKAVTNLVKDNLIKYDIKSYHSTPVEEMPNDYRRSQWYPVSALSTIEIYRRNHDVQYIYIKTEEGIHTAELDEVSYEHFKYVPYTDMEVALQFYRTTDSAEVTIKNPIIKSGSGALNLADYINFDTEPYTPKGSFKPAPSYTFYDGEYMPVHTRLVYKDGYSYLVFCIIHHHSSGSELYLIFKEDSRTNTYSYSEAYSGVYGNVPGWVYEAFNEGQVNVIDRVWKGINVLPPITNGYYAAIDGMRVDLEYKVIYYIKDNVNRQQLVFHFKSSIIGSGYDILVYDDNFSNDCWSLNSHYSFDSAPECYRKLFYNNEDVENFVVGSTLFSSAIVETKMELINEYTVKQTNILMLDNNYSVVKSTDEEGNEINVLRIK